MPARLLCWGEAGVTLVGTDAQSIGPAGNEQVPHLELLNRNMVILEGVDLTGVPDGHYTLCCLPLKLKGLGSVAGTGRC